MLITDRASVRALESQRFRSLASGRLSGHLKESQRPGLANDFGLHSPWRMGCDLKAASAGCAMPSDGIEGLAESEASCL